MIKKCFFLIICSLFLVNYHSLGQSNHLHKIDERSNKPPFDELLNGITTWRLYDNTACHQNFFPNRYVIQEILDYMNKTIPDATYGDDYTDIRPSHLDVTLQQMKAKSYYKDYFFVTVLLWDIQVELVFKLQGLDYTYTFSIPEITVRSDDYDDHALYEALCKKIDYRTHHYSYNYLKSLSLGGYTTDYSEFLIKKTLKGGLSHPCEGIYEEVANENKYELAVKEIDNKLCLIYLGGAFLYKGWNPGDVKAILYETATPYIYKASWYMANKTIKDAYVSFIEGGMKVYLNNDETIYLKTWPTVSDNISIIQDREEWGGTGFVLKDGYIVTNYHVVEEAKQITIND